MKMKYAGWMTLKLLASALVAAGLWVLLSVFLPPAPTGLLKNWPRLGSDLSFTFAFGLVFIVGCGLVWLSVLDQRFRCRTCARKLRMPQGEGTFSSVWLGGSPYTEYICTYGHGKLYFPEVHLASGRGAYWVPYDSLWEDLLQAEEMAVGGGPRRPPDRGR